MTTADTSILVRAGGGASFRVGAGVPDSRMRGTGVAAAAGRLGPTVDAVLDAAAAPVSMLALGTAALDSDDRRPDRPDVFAELRTPRRHEVLDLLGRGLSTNEIAESSRPSASVRDWSGEA
jgi:hypothetical protein